MNYFSLDKKKDTGFSLIELVVVVGVLAVLSAIAMPSFICFPKKAKATAALAALKQIKTECALKEAEAKPEIFNSSALDGYTIQTSGSNSCAGSNGVISALPNDANELPTFNLASDTGLLTYKFKGMEGTNLSGCLGLICGNGIFSNNSNEIKKKYNIKLEYIELRKVNNLKKTNNLKNSKLFDDIKNEIKKKYNIKLEYIELRKVNNLKKTNNLKNSKLFVAY